MAPRRRVQEYEQVWWSKLPARCVCRNAINSLDCHCKSLKIKITGAGTYLQRKNVFRMSFRVDIENTVYMLLLVHITNVCEYKKSEKHIIQTL